MKLIVKMMREEMENIASDQKENYETNMKPTKGESQNTSPLVENKMFMNAKSGESFTNWMDAFETKF